MNVEQNQNIVTQLYNISPEQLFSFLTEIASDVKQLKEQQPTLPKFLSRKEVSDMLGVDLGTVRNWTNNGTIPALELGGRILYRLTDIEASMRLRKPKVKSNNG